MRVSIESSLSKRHFFFASVPLPFSFRFASVLQVKLQSVSEVSAALWNISLESLIWLWNAFTMDLLPPNIFASVLLPFCFRFASVMRVKLYGSKASEKGTRHLESISAVRALCNPSNTPVGTMEEEKASSLQNLPANMARTWCKHASNMLSSMMATQLLKLVDPEHRTRARGYISR